MNAQKEKTEKHIRLNVIKDELRAKLDSYIGGWSLPEYKRSMALRM